MRVLFAEKTPATGDQAKKPGERDAWKEIRRGNPLAGGRRGQLPFRGTDIRTAAKEGAGIGDRKGFRERRIGPRREIDIRLVGTMAGQYCQAMFTLGDRGSNGRKARVDAGDARGRTRDVELFAYSGITSQLREPKSLALIGEASIGDRQLLLQSAKLEVVACHLGCHDHAHIIERGLESFGRG